MGFCQDDVINALEACGLPSLPTQFTCDAGIFISCPTPHMYRFFIEHLVCECNNDLDCLLQHCQSLLDLCKTKQQCQSSGKSHYEQCHGSFGLQIVVCIKEDYEIVDNNLEDEEGPMKAKKDDMKVQPNREGLFKSFNFEKLQIIGYTSTKVIFK